MRQRVMRREIQAADITTLEHHLTGIIGLLAQVCDHVDVRQQRVLGEQRPARLHRSGTDLRQVDVHVEVDAIGT